MLGFGDDTLAGIVLGDGQALLCREGRTTAGAGARISTDAGDRGWRATGPEGLQLEFEPLGRAAEFADGGREWLCRARGSLGDGPIDCLGHAVLTPPLDRPLRRGALQRSVAAWLDEELAIALHAQRPARAKHHEAEELDAFVLRGSPAEPHPIADPRLSTAYDGDGRQRRAGLELWETEDSPYPLRLAGEASAVGELELPDGMRLRCAFLRWHHDGRTGAGRYDILLPG